MVANSMKKEMRIIGSNAAVEFIGHGIKIPAKIDTGADSSSLWASKIQVDPKGKLSFVLFDEGFEHYTGEVITRKKFRVASIKSSSGHTEIRYRVDMVIKLGGRKIRATFTLSGRGTHKFPVLIGRRTLVNKFLVNVSKRAFPRNPGDVTQSLNIEMKKNPYKFYMKHHVKNEK